MHVNHNITQISFFTIMNLHRWKAYMNGKMLFDDKLRGKKRAIRPMMITRVYLQHEVCTYVCISDSHLFYTAHMKCLDSFKAIAVNKCCFNTI